MPVSIAARAQRSFVAVDDLARHLAAEYADIFGRDGFYLELMDHGLPEQQAMNPKLLRLAAESGLGGIQCLVELLAGTNVLGSAASGAATGNLAG